MRDAVRRQILSDMGIETWQLRAASAGAAPERAGQRPSAVTPQPVVTGEPAAAQPAPAPAPTRRRPAVSAISLAAPGVVLLVEGGISRRDHRLARDLLAAVTGDWRAKAVNRRFDWVSEQGDESAADTARRALWAFVQKDLEDHVARLLVCVAPLAERLPEGVPEDGIECRRLIVPALAALGHDAGAKRAVWQALAEARR